jgi:hypothetical protein
MTGAESALTRTGNVICDRDNDSYRRFICKVNADAAPAVTLTEGISVRAIRMFPQLGGSLRVERACIKLDVFV